MGWWWLTACPVATDGSLAESATEETGDPEDRSISAHCDPTDNPLRFWCTVTVDPPQPVQITFVRTDGDGPVRVHSSDATAGTHEVPLYFLEDEEDYTWTAAALSDPDGLWASGTFTSGEVPNTVFSQIEITGTSSVSYIGTHDPCRNHATAVVYDTTSGRIVWYESLDDAGTLGFLNMVRFSEGHTILGETGSRVVEVDLTGEELLRLDRGKDYEADLHHDLFGKDGYTYLLYHEGFGPLLDGILVFDGHKPVADWKAGEHLLVPPDAVGDWLHTNTVTVDDEGRWLLSSFAQNAIFEVNGEWTDPAFGAVEWVLAGSEAGALGQDFAVEWGAIVPAEFGMQHDVHWVGDGQLVLLDNPRGRVLVLDVDEKARTATVRGAYPTAEPECGPQGTAHVSSSGNVFAGCNGSTLTEYTPDGTFAWSGVAQCAGFTNAVRLYPLEGW